MPGHIRVERFESSGWTDTGGTFGGSNSSSDASIGSVDSVPYVAWREFNGTGTDIKVAAFSGGVWSAVGASLSVDGSQFAEHPRIASIGPNIATQHPEVVWTEKSNTAPGNYKIRVKRFNLGTWTEVVGSPNYDASKDAFDPTIASLNGVPYVAWKESDGSSYRVRVAQLSGGAWVSVGGAVSGSGSADNPAIANVGGVPYVTWDELDGTSSVYVARFSAGSWSTVGGALNVNGSANARNPSIANIGGVPYVAWDETQGSDSVVRVKRLVNNNSWTEVVDGALNVDPGKVAVNPTIANVGGVPYVAFSEANGTAYQTRVKRLEPDFVSQSATPTPQQTGAKLSAFVHTYGIPFPIGFDYGTALEHQTTTDTATAGSEFVTVTKTVGGLNPATTYKFRPFANAGVPAPLAFGPIGSFKPDSTPPSFLSAALNPPRFAVDPSGTAETPVSKATKKPPRGTRLTYKLSEAARVVVTVQRARVGRRVNGKCVRETKANRKRPKCTRYKRAGRFARKSHAGANSTRFSGRIGKTKLAAGRYRMTLVATDAADNRSRPKRLTFRIVKG
jgi:hypothetical protein